MDASDEAVTIANQLAESMRAEGGLAAFRLSVRLRQLADETARTATPAAASPRSAAPITRVGIWERETRDGQDWFVRRRHHDLWADVAEIPPKSAKQRVLLIGESIARGFFYEPHVTPSIVLQTMLCEAAGDEGIEVIDLGHSSLQAQALLQLTESAFALEPDAILILAGNNWHPIDAVTPRDLGEMAAGLRAGGPWSEIKAHLERLARAKAQSIVAALGRMSAAHHVPMVITVPEFNLVDWRSDAEEPPFLPDDDLATWLSTRDAAARALAEGRNGEAERLAQDLLDLDGGTVAQSVRLKAEARRTARPEQMRPLLERARDAAMWALRKDTPRPYRPIQDVLREEAPRQGIGVIDLPRRFEEYLGKVPGRELFGDYCHFTLDGMRVAMASAAEVLLPILERPQAAWRRLSDIDLGVTARVRARGSLLAGIHNANWGNRLDVVMHHLETALRQDPSIADLMRLYLESHLRSAPPQLCGAVEEVVRVESRSLASFFFRSTRREKDANLRLDAAMIEVLSRDWPAIAADARRLMAAEHAVSQGPRNLLSRAYAGLQIDQALDDPERYAYFRAWTRTSRFQFVCDRLEDLHVRMTVRTPVHLAGGAIAVRVNDVLVRALDASNVWRTTECLATARALRQGLNTLEIIWPEAGWAYAHRVSAVVRAFDAGQPMDANPVFGELHTLSVAPTVTRQPAPAGQAVELVDG